MTMTIRKQRKLLGFLLCVLLIVTLIPNVSAENTDAPMQGALTVLLRHSYAEDGVTRAISGVTVSVYRVASMDGDGALTAVQAFQSFQEDFQKADGLQTLIPSLKSLVDSASVAADGSAVSDTEGRARFEALDPGLYLLLLGEGTHPDHPATRVGFQNALLTVPYRGTAGDNLVGLEDPSSWDYDFSFLPKSFEVGKVDRIQKIWKDNQDAKHLRPRELNVEILYEDGKRQTLVLNAENGWILEFVPVSLSAVKEVRETNLPEVYVFRGSELVGTTIQITNELDEPGGGTPTPSDHDPGLPYTGQLWWPVPVLVVSGAVLILLGLILRRRKKNHEAA